MRDAILIRRETPDDYRAVEELTRKAFWNLYVPGCHEHYLAHIMRMHRDFVSELDLVLELRGQVVASIMYTKAKLTDESGAGKEILTFGPVCVAPGYQRQGYGKELMEASFEKAAGLGYDVIVIFGNPGNYVGRGFKSCKKYNVCTENGSFPSAMLVKELREGTLNGTKWVYHESPVFTLDEADVLCFDQGFEKMERKYLPCQEEFYIHSHSTIS